MARTPEGRGVEVTCVEETLGEVEETYPPVHLVVGASFHQGTEEGEFPSLERPFPELFFGNTQLYSECASCLLRAAVDRLWRSGPDRYRNNRSRISAYPKSALYDP